MISKNIHRIINNLPLVFVFFFGFTIQTWSQSLESKKQQFALPKGIVLNAGQYPSFVTGNVTTKNASFWIMNNGFTIDFSFEDVNHVVQCLWVNDKGIPLIQENAVSKEQGRIESFRNKNRYSIVNASSIQQQFEKYASIEFLQQDSLNALTWNFNAESKNISLPCIKIEGIDNFEIVKQGTAIQLSVHGNQIVIPLPIVVDKKTGVHCPIQAIKRDDGIIYLSRGENSKPERMLAVPILFSTIFGGSREEIIKGIAIDGNSNVFVCGITQSVDFPTTTGAYVASKNGMQDIFIAKFDSSGKTPKYMAMIGGSSFDQVNAIAIDSLGNAYITGSTTSMDFPSTSNSFQPNKTIADEDVFVACINASGSDLLYSTFLKGIADDAGTSIAVDKVGLIYVCGTTGALYNSPHTFPKTKAAFDTTYNGGALDGFVSVIKPEGKNNSDLMFSSLLGGDGNDIPASLTIDEQGKIYVVGETYSAVGFPIIKNGLQETFSGLSDGFLSVFNKSIDSLLYSTFIGGSYNERISDIAFDESSQSVFIAGSTGSDGVRTSDGNIPAAFPVTSGAFDTTYNGGNNDGFLMRLQPFAQQQLRYSTFIGGNDEDKLSGISIDVCSAPYVTGYSQSTDFPITDDAPDKQMQKRESIIAKLNATGNVLVFSSLFGGDNEDESNGVAVDRTGAIYIGGKTSGSGLPSNAQNTNGVDAFIAKMQIGILPLKPTINHDGPLEFCKGNKVTLDASSRNFVAYQWSKDNQKINGANTATLTATESGIYSVDVVDASGCTGQGSVVVSVYESSLISFAKPPVLCQGDSALLTMSIKDTIVSYVWSPDTTLSCSTCENPQASPFTTTTYSLTVINKNGCISTDSVTVYVIDSTALNIVNAVDTLAVCTNVSDTMFIPIKNTIAVPLYAVIQKKINPKFSPIQDSLLIQGDSVGLFPVIFNGSAQEGFFDIQYSFANQCGYTQTVKLVASVEKPEFLFSGNKDTTICQFSAMSKNVVIENKTRLKGTATIISIEDGFTVNPSTVIFTSKSIENVVVSFIGDSIGDYNGKYIVQHSCGDQDTFDITVHVVAKQVAFELKKADSIYKKTGAQIIQELTVDSLNILNQMSGNELSFSLIYEKTALSLDSVHSAACNVAMNENGNNVTVSLSACRTFVNPIARLHYKTLVGETLHPWTKLEQIIIGDQCFKLNLLSVADTMNLLPYGCELNTVKVGNVISSLASVIVDEVGQQVRIRYGIAENLSPTISFMNILGQNIKALTLPSVLSGEYEITLPIDEFLQGRYMIVYSAGRYSSAQTMLITR